MNISQKTAFLSDRNEMKPSHLDTGRVHQISLIDYNSYKWLKSRAMLRQMHKINPIIEKQLQEMFNHLDEDKSGSIDIKELDLAMKYTKNNEKESIAILENFSKIDQDNSGTIEFNEFADIMTSGSEARYLFSADEAQSSILTSSFFQFASSHRRIKIVDVIDDKEKQLLTRYKKFGELFSIPMFPFIQTDPTHNSQNLNNAFFVPGLRKKLTLSNYGNFWDEYDADVGEARQEHENNHHVVLPVVESGENKIPHLLSDEAGERVNSDREINYKKEKLCNQNNQISNNSNSTVFSAPSEEEKDGTSTRSSVIGGANSDVNYEAQFLEQNSCNDTSITRDWRMNTDERSNIKLNENGGIENNSQYWDQLKRGSPTTIVNLVNNNSNNTGYNSNNNSNNNNNNNNTGYNNAGNSMNTIVNTSGGGGGLNKDKDSINVSAGGRRSRPKNDSTTPIVTTTRIPGSNHVRGQNTRSVSISNSTCSLTTLQVLQLEHQSLLDSVKQALRNNPLPRRSQLHHRSQFYDGASSRRKYNDKKRDGDCKSSTLSRRYNTMVHNSKRKSMLLLQPQVPTRTQPKSTAHRKQQHNYKQNKNNPRNIHLVPFKTI